MAKKPKNKMSVSDRAKQFAPFAALTGLEEALEKVRKEMIAESRKSPFEDETAKINRVIKLLKKNDIVRVIYFTEVGYVPIEGKVKKISLDEKYLVIDYTKIDFEDIADIAII